MAKVLCRYKVTHAEGRGLELLGEGWQEPDFVLLDKADPKWVGNGVYGEGWRQWEIMDMATHERTGVIVADLLGPHEPSASGEGHQ
jgi:hypothetical protein